MKRTPKTKCLGAGLSTPLWVADTVTGSTTHKRSQFLDPVQGSPKFALGRDTLSGSHGSGGCSTFLSHRRPHCGAPACSTGEGCRSHSTYSLCLQGLLSVHHHPHAERLLNRNYSRALPAPPFHPPAHPSPKDCLYIKQEESCTGCRITFRSPLASASHAGCF